MWIFVILLLANGSWCSSLSVTPETKLAKYNKLKPVAAVTASKVTNPVPAAVTKSITPAPNVAKPSAPVTSGQTTNIQTTKLATPATTTVIPNTVVQKPTVPVTTPTIISLTPVTTSKVINPVLATAASKTGTITSAPITTKAIMLASPPTKTNPLLGQHNLMSATSAPVLCPVAPAAGCIVAGAGAPYATQCCSGYAVGGRPGQCESSNQACFNSGSCYTISDCPDIEGLCPNSCTYDTARDNNFCNGTNILCHTALDCPPPTWYCSDVTLPICTQLVGQSCSKDSDCLSKACNNNICVPQVSGDLCDENCNQITGVNGICEAGKWSSCVSLGASCSSSLSCCSNNCDTTGKNPACPAGQSCCVCVATGQACSGQAATACCAGDICLASQLCGPCITNGANCTVSTDCCSDNCDTTGKNPACSAGQACCVCQVVGKSCVNNSGCCSGICTNNICQAAPVGGNCKTNGDCVSQLCDPSAKTCDCVLENDSCSSTGACCNDLPCVGGTCQCAITGQTCLTSNQCCQGTGTGASGTEHLACIGNPKICQVVANCPENLGLDLAQIQAYFMIAGSQNTISPNCLVAYKLLIYNYTIFAQYLTLVNQDLLSCLPATVTSLQHTLYNSLVVLQANCLSMNASAPYFSSFNATAQVDTLNQQLLYVASNQAYLDTFTTGTNITANLGVFNNLQPNQAVVNQLAAVSSYPAALQWGTFTDQICQQSANSGSCTCEANISNQIASATCISMPCCVGDISLDLANNAATMTVQGFANLADANTANANTGVLPIITPLSATNIVTAASLVDPTYGTIDPTNIYACTADRFLSLVNCWMATLPASCTASADKLSAPKAKVGKK